MTPIFHLSFPVRDLEEALAFYTETLGATVGRQAGQWADIGLFGAQVTLHQAPRDIDSPMPRTRHFGATLAWPEWEKLTGGLKTFIESPRVMGEGTEHEQGKAMIGDPSGNLIELKAYRFPQAVLPPSVVQQS